MKITNQELEKIITDIIINHEKAYEVRGAATLALTIEKAFRKANEDNYKKLLIAISALNDIADWDYCKQCGVRLDSVAKARESLSNIEDVE